MAKRKRPPMQPIVMAKDGVIQFQENVVVRRLLDEATARGFDLNALVRACADAPATDWDQFNQLIGYSVSGLPWKQKRTRDEADAIVEKMIADRGKKP